MDASFSADQIVKHIISIILAEARESELGLEESLSLLDHYHNKIVHTLQKGNASLTKGEAEMQIYVVTLAIYSHFDTIVVEKKEAFTRETDEEVKIHEEVDEKLRAEWRDKVEELQSSYTTSVQEVYLDHRSSLDELDLERGSLEQERMLRRVQDDLLFEFRKRVEKLRSEYEVYLKRASRNQRKDLESRQVQHFQDVAEYVSETYGGKVGAILNEVE